MPFRRRPQVLVAPPPVLWEAGKARRSGLYGQCQTVPAPPINRGMFAIHLQGQGTGAKTFRRLGPGVVMDTDHRLTKTSATDAQLDATFHALSDGTRRDIVRRCLQESPSMSRLASAYPMSYTAVQKHVHVLERAGLISRVRHGREQLVTTEIAALHGARQALDKLESDWRQRIVQMSGLLVDPEKKEGQE